MNTLFPIYVKMQQIQTLVVGAGPVGLEKLQAIFNNSPEAKVRVVAEVVTAEFKEFVRDLTTVTVAERSFQEADLENIDLAILATDNESLNNWVRKLANEKHILLNVADKPSLCDFYLGSVVQKGDLKIGISTNGKSPTIAKRVKELLQELIPEEIDETLALMQEMRNGLKGDLQQKITVLNAHTKELLEK